MSALTEPDIAGVSAALNPEQRNAVDHMDGPLLVLAGAGTGKTRVLTTRVVHIIRSGRADPDRVLAVTFTNKAARQMQERIATGIGHPIPTAGAHRHGGFNRLWIGTFHSLCARILRRHGEQTKLGDRFTILDSSDSLRLIRNIITERNIDKTQYPAELFASLIEQWKNDGLGPAEASDTASSKNGITSIVLPVYRQYQEHLGTLKAVDFGDIILHCLRLLRSDRTILELYQNLFHYILVDEYQDTNTAQYLWLRLLASKHSNICCVGDDDQSIYSWRGAKVGNILRFEKDFANARIVRLERNYRSTGHILASAEGLIAHNRQRLGKTLWTDSGDGIKPQIQQFYSSDEESRRIGQTIVSLDHQSDRQSDHQSDHQNRHGGNHGGAAMEKTAILVRTAAQTRAFEQAFLQASIPYRIIGGLRFYERAEIRDATAWIRAAGQSHDDLAFLRICERPKRGIGATSLDKMRQYARENAISLSDCAAGVADGSISIPRISGKARDQLGKLCEKLRKWRLDVDHMPLKSWVDMILEESGYMESWRHDPSPDAPGKIENLEEMIAGMSEFDDVTSFLEHISLIMESGREEQEAQSGKGVMIMTIHNAKGLEFDAVFLPGWEEGLFPHQRSIEEKANGIEEERRLAYVAITRARRHLFISWVRQRYIYRRVLDCVPSRFLAELPPEHIAQSSPATGYSQSRGNAYARKRAPSEPTADAMPRSGDRIRHQRFGSGVVIKIHGNRLDVVFNDGIRTVLRQFIETDPSTDDDQASFSP